MSDIEIKKDGFKTSILTYISSYSISAIVIVFGLICYYYPIFGEPLKFVFPVAKMSIEMKIFFLFMIFIITYPLGLLFAWISWSLLGWSEKNLETLHFKNNKLNFLSKGSKNYFCFNILVEEFKLTKSNFYSTCRLQEAYMQKDKNGRELLHSLDDSQGISNLIRHLILFSIIFLTVFLIKLEFVFALISFLVGLFLLIINSAVCFHYSLAILMFCLNDKMKNKGCESCI